MKIALAGNPNCGKTTLFNKLTGSSAHVGNWPGVTVERREGIYTGGIGQRKDVGIIDLPGIYSLSPYSPEECVARDYLLGKSGDKPDVIINIINVMQFERSLYLTTQLLELGCPVVVALNMTDIFERKRGSIDIDSIERLLKVPIVRISALKSEKLDDLMNLALSAASTPRSAWSILSESDLSSCINPIRKILDKAGVEESLFTAVNLLCGDIESGSVFSADASLRSHIRLAEQISPDGDIAAHIADLRYKYICGYVTLFVNRTKDEVTASAAVDRVFTHKFLGIPIFFAMMFLVFHLTFSENMFMLGIPGPGAALFGLTEQLIEFITECISTFFISVNVAEWAQSLFVDAVWGGVSSVLTFLPQIMVLFFFLSILEDSGYMARAAFIMDKPLRVFGLSGKSFVPMLMGFGCSVPAVMATRTIENEKDRRLTIMLVPFMSCGAKFPIHAIFGAALFREYGDFAVFGIYLLGVLFAAFSGILLKNTVFKGGDMPFLMEMPDYHLPSVKSLIMLLWEKLRGFLVRAGTIIAVATIVVWFLQNFSLTFEMVGANSDRSILSQFGNLIRPIFMPLGFAGGDHGWIPIVAILTGFIAKEVVVSTLTQLYTVSAADIPQDAESEQNLASQDAFTESAIADSFTPLAALSFMAFNLLCIPCFAAVGAMRKELSSRKMLAFTLLYQLVSAWIVAFVIYNIGSLFINN
ncbi:ferrous iron transport protein B [Clostridia bacterium]|nr:ferrous iron transport protein B [Clostridia bacterium]